MIMDQPEEILEKLERFNVQKNPEITRELDEYVSFVARTGESVFNWALVKKLYREKLINVITEFYNEQPTKELPQYPNVDPFNYETMKKMLIERLDSFSAAPFTIQRISELLSDPRKQYSRIDKFMRAVEKNILVVSTVSPSRNRSEESENGDSLDSVGLNGDFSSDVNVDIDMENDGSFTMTKEFSTTVHRKEPTHEVVTETQETVTIKKVASKEEEATTSTIAVNGGSNGEPLQPTQTDVKIETHTTVTVTLAADETKAQTEGGEKVEETQKAEDTVIKSDVQHEPITLLTENVEPKIDDALLNEPLRPIDDEILPESLETTPLAALENIVATRVEVETPARIEEPVVPKQDEMITEQTVIEQPKQMEQEETPIEKSEQEEQKTEQVTESETACDESGIEAKRIKIDEAESKPEEAPENVQSEQEAPVEQEPEKIESVQVSVIEEPKEDQKQPEEPEKKEEIVAAVEEKAEEVPEVSQPVEKAAEVEPIVEEEVKVDENIPVVSEPIIEPEIAPQTVEEPEPIAEIEPIVENTTMEVAAVPEVAPEMETVAQNNKMDTDDNEETMETDETEEVPMDQ